MSTEPTAPLAVDLHLHSLHSDGVLPAADVIDRAADGGARLLALTDHDTVAGLEEARERCRFRGVGFVSGVELSCTWRGQTLHVLGFDFDPLDAALLGRLEEVRELRRTRLREVARRLDRHRIPASELLSEIEPAHVVLTRTHLARALIAAHHARSLPEVFKRFLGRGSPGHVGSNYPSLESSIECIGAAGGVAVLAHPLRYALSAGARRQMLEQFRLAGGRGMEVVCGGARTQVEALATLAVRFGLAGSAGSDFHDPQIPWNPPGRLAKLPASVRPIWHGFGSVDPTPVSSAHEPAH